MKALLFYITTLLTLVIICSEPSGLWALLVTIDIPLVLWGINNLTIKEVTKFTGYKAWYRLIHK